MIAIEIGERHFKISAPGCADFTLALPLTPTDVTTLAMGGMACRLSYVQGQTRHTRIITAVNGKIVVGAAGVRPQARRYRQG